MRKIYTLLGTMAFICTGAFAQHTASKLVTGITVTNVKKPAAHLNKAVNDTLGIDDFYNAIYPAAYGYGYYNSILDGYYGGTAWVDSSGAPGPEWGDFVGYFNLGNNYIVTDILGVCWHKNYAAGGGTSKIIGGVQLIDTTTWVVFTNAPNDTIYYDIPYTQVGDTGSITVAQLDTVNGFFTIHLSTPAHIMPIDGDWGVYVDFRDCYNNSDTIGLAINTPAAGATETNLPYTNFDHDFVLYHNYNLGQTFWMRSKDRMATGFTAGIWAVIEDQTGINHYDAKGLKMYQNAPNPSNGNTTINYRLKNTGMAYFRVLSSTGKVVYQENGTKQAGVTNKVVFNQGQLAAGIYFYQLNANGETLTMKMVITK